MTLPLKAADAVVAGKHGAPLISDRKLQALYSSLLRATLFTEDLSKHSAARQAKANGGHGRPAPVMRPEAALAAFLEDLQEGDILAADPVLPAARLLAGVLLPTVVEASLAPAPAPLAQHERTVSEEEPAALDAIAIPPAIATGLALTLQQEYPGAVVIAITAAPQMDRATLRFAGEHRLPILYVLLPEAGATKKPAPDWSGEAILDQVPCIPADGNDLVALYRVAQESMTRARQQGGPTLIDCKHIALGPNDSNPLARMEAHLERKGLLPAGRRQQLTDGFHRELQQARSALPALTRQHKRG